MAGGFLVLLAVAFMLYVRFAPSDPARWHQPVTATADEDRTGGAVRVLDGGAEAFARIDEAARTLPRTAVLAGSGLSAAKAITEPCTRLASGGTFGERSSSAGHPRQPPPGSSPRARPWSTALLR